MTKNIFASVAWLCLFAAPAFAAPSFSATPGGVQAGAWVWDIHITPDLALVSDGSGTPVAVEFGFRLTGGQLLSATIGDPLQFDTPNPGPEVFGWETPDPFDPDPNEGYGLQSNLLTNEVFASYGSINFTSPGPKHFLTIRASGPPTSLSSTIQWLGAYSGSGKIVQITGGTFPNYQTGDFFFAGSATQAIPEPATTALLAVGSLVTVTVARRRRPVGCTIK
jgi:hypothetical protein